MAATIIPRLATAAMRVPLKGTCAAPAWAVVHMCAPSIGGLPHNTAYRGFAGTTQGRRSRLQKSPATAPLHTEEIPAARQALPTAFVPFSWHSMSNPAPSLQRLSITQAERDAVGQLGRSKGPMAAYDELLRISFLERDPAQVKCVVALQAVWESSRQYCTQRRRWQNDHHEWQAEHDTWKKIMQERAASEKDALSDEANVPLSAHSVPRAAPEVDDGPCEPVEPVAPVPQTHGCYIWGSVGGGKSLLMDLLVDCCGHGFEPDFRVLRVHFHEFMQVVHKEFHRRRQAGVERTTSAVARQLAGEVRLLAFDEFQITNIADALIVETLFDALLAEGVSVLMTSNRPPEDLYKDGLNRHLAIPQFLALLERRSVTMHELAAARDFRAPDANVTGPLRDFICKPDMTAHGDVEARLQAAFLEASGSLGGEPVSVALPWGRSMAVGEAAGGVGRFTFSELCGTACTIGADDYLELADQFHTLLVTDVPRFSMDKHNEARRFTNLVDCLYERHARLVISSDVFPDRLLMEMEKLIDFVPNAIGGKKRTGAPPTLAPSSPFTSEPISVTEAVGAKSSGRAGSGDDDAATGADIAGVMTGAVASLQESGFAAKRAVSRLLHMQSEEYLRVHQRHRLQ